MSREIFRSGNGCVRLTAFVGETREDGGHRGRLQVDADLPFPLNALSIEDVLEMDAAIGKWLLDLAGPGPDGVPIVGQSTDVVYKYDVPAADRSDDLMRSAIRICEDNMRILHTDHIGHPEGCTFSHIGGRSITVHGKNGDQRRLEIMVSQQIRPDSGIVIPAYEILERAAVVLMQESQRVLAAVKGTLNG